VARNTSVSWLAFRGPQHEWAAGFLRAGEILLEIPGRLTMARKIGDAD